MLIFSEVVKPQGELVVKAGVVWDGRLASPLELITSAILPHHGRLAD